MPTHTYTFGLTKDGGPSDTVSVAKSAEGEINQELSVAQSQTDLAIACAFDKDELESIRLLSDQDMTIETNSGSEADDTISLKANVPWVWLKDGGVANPFTADVTGLFATTGAFGATPATLKINVLVDPTP